MSTENALRPVLYRVLGKSSEEVRPGSVPGSVTVETHTDTVASGMADKSTQTAGYRRVNESPFPSTMKMAKAMRTLLRGKSFIICSILVVDF